MLPIALAMGASAPARAQTDEEEPPGVLARGQVPGNQYISPETLLFYVSTKPGNRFDTLTLREDFRRLWDTGFVEDLSIDVRDGTKGKIVTFHVVERKRIQIVDFRGSKALSKSSI